jgi:hypothetical protein
MANEFYRVHLTGDTREQFRKLSEYMNSNAVNKMLDIGDGSLDLRQHVVAGHIPNGTITMNTMVTNARTGDGNKYDIDVHIVVETTGKLAEHVASLDEKVPGLTRDYPKPDGRM